MFRADDIDVVHSDARFRLPGMEDLERVGVCDGPFYEWRKRTLPVLDGSEHLRLRFFVNSAFSPRQMQRLQEVARERAHALIDRHAESGRMEVLRDFSDDLPLWSMCRFIGLDEEDWLEILECLVGTEDMFSPALTAQQRERGEASIVALNDYVARLVNERRRSPRKDLVSELVALQAKSGEPGEQDFIALLVNVIGGAVGSTRAAISNAILEFARHPEQAALVRDDAALIGPAVEECLRFHPPFRLARRVARERLQMFGVVLEAGQSVLMLRGTYNRDPERFEQPHRFDIRRPPQRNLSFGYGPHMCLGQSIARVNLQQGITAFLQRCRDLELVAQPLRLPFTMDEKLDALQVSFRHQPRTKARPIPIKTS